MNRITYFALLFFLFSDITFGEEFKHKPKVNHNTQIRVEYGCKRPRQWGNVEKVITLSENTGRSTIDNSEDIEKISIYCLFTTRHFVLFNTSFIEPAIEIKQCKKGKADRTCCKVVAGEWLVHDGKENVIETNPANLQIDHILPFSYIRLNMNDCKKINLYYNYLPNLTPELSKVNNKKSDVLCETKEICEKQKQICHQMANEFDDEKMCDELDKIE